ncbi:unnamed protein product [Callosobruchus maculatus]|uniref:CHORD domain-containing protein n=2 Tax=Callosobruchus maculatus TaxID=64391 RepID=A0A653D808_CALMS|nr:unnamed protein product [Callosobruchus maculatus]
MPAEKPMLQCYNRGCGQKYDPDTNTDGNILEWNRTAKSCRHHPGLPVFHDAYKGWGCCNKKCTDFTEFLNIKGCTLSKHSNVKPPEPEKPVVKDDIPDTEEVEVKAIVPPSLQRPPIDTPMVIMKPNIAPSLMQQLSAPQQEEKKEALESDEIQIGTNCKNGGCQVTYQGPDTNNSLCTYHPGVPIFHEGMKYWSCCQRKTSDFNSFLNQAGCNQGRHVWKKDESEMQKVQCRWDFHQTGTHVIVSVYAKKYCPKESIVKLSPIRLCLKLVFPQQADATFDLDYELRGIIDVSASEVSMYGTKVEIKMKKAEPGAWTKLGSLIETKDEKKETKTRSNIDNVTPQMQAVDLDDL